MKKKFLKLLIILFILGVGVFVNIDGVKALTEQDCYVMYEAGIESSQDYLTSCLSEADDEDVCQSDHQDTLFDLGEALQECLDEVTPSTPSTPPPPPPTNTDPATAPPTDTDTATAPPTASPSSGITPFRSTHEVPTEGILRGVKCAGGSGVVCDLCDFFRVAINVSELIVAISGVIGFLLFIYAGILFLLVPYKPDYISKAKGMMVAVVIGLVIVFGAYTIVRFTITTIGYAGGDWAVCSPVK